MSKYTFTFKKGEIFVEFTTADRDVVERQFQIWVNSADEYAKRNKERTSTVRAAEALPNSIPPVQAPQMPSNNAVAGMQSQTNSENFAAQTATTPEVKPTAPAPAPTSEPIIDKASNLLKTINSIQNPQAQPQQQEPNNFESVLEQSIETSKFEPEKTKDPVFMNLIKSKNTTDKFHYLMITSYYLTEFEKMDRFSLKQINAKLMQNMSEIIDHSMLQEALNQGFMELVPDLTGMAEVAEYKLTRLGEDFFSNRI